MKNSVYDCIIIGGGASGMYCAARLVRAVFTGKKEFEDVVFEKQASEDMTEASAGEPESEAFEETAFDKKESEPAAAEATAYVPTEFISDSDFEEF